MMFIQLTFYQINSGKPTEKKVLCNMDHVTRVVSYADYSELDFSNGGQVAVCESYDSIFNTLKL